DNQLIADQRGIANYAEGVSSGVSNSVKLDQSGMGNQSYVNQLYGDHNEVNIKQADGANLAYVTQGGTGNQAIVDQSGVNMNAAIQQFGMGNQATVFQQ
ncbi:curlin, partial [Pseudomonas laurentiana]|nr:curlin [Pseudomonas laurentiana]